MAIAEGSVGGVGSANVCDPFYDGGAVAGFFEPLCFWLMGLLYTKNTETRTKFLVTEQKAGHGIAHFLLRDRLF